jgi:hypothetical protein
VEESVVESVDEATVVESVDEVDMVEESVQESVVHGKSMNKLPTFSAAHQGQALYCI